MHQKALDVARKVNTCHTDIVQLFHILGGDDFIKTESSLEELSDWGYALKQSSNQLEELKKDLDKKIKLIEMLVCLLWIKRDDPDPVRTEYTIASPRVKIMSEMPSPKRDEEKYKKLLEYLGFNKLAIDTDSARPHWPGIVELCTRLAEQGKPFPPGIDPEKTYPIYAVTFRAKNGGLLTD